MRRLRPLSPILAVAALGAGGYFGFARGGTVLASIDDSLYRARAEQSKASVRSATSLVAQAKAKLDAARAKVPQARPTPSARKPMSSSTRPRPTRPARTSGAPRVSAAA